MDEFKTLTRWIPPGAEVIAVLVTGLAMGEAVWRPLPIYFRFSARDAPKERLHREKEDVRRTAIAPTWTEIGQFAAIAVLRTALNFFLPQAMERAVARDDFAVRGGA